MATLIERMMMEADFETDGGAIQADQLDRLLLLFAAGDVDAAYIDAALGGLTVGQRAELDEILATAPLDDRAVWAITVSAHIYAGLLRWPDHTTAAEVRAELGL